MVKASETVTTAQQKRNSRTQQLAPYQFKAGVVNNPNGRPKGSRNKLSESVIRDILADWEVAGASAIQICRLEDPGAYLRVVTSLIPKELNIREGDNALDKILGQFSDEQLSEILAAVTVASVTPQGPTNKVKEIARSESDGVY